jgi:hypothetical protein
MSSLRPSVTHWRRAGRSTRTTPTARPACRPTFRAWPRSTESRFAGSSRRSRRARPVAAPEPSPIEPSAAFRLYRDRIKTRDPAVERRRHHFERIFRELRKAGVWRGNLYLAWDFTVASGHSLAGRMLHIRDHAFAGLGDRNLADLAVAGSAPTLTVDSVTDLTPAEDDRNARRVEGTLTAPCYLTNGCAPGGGFNFESAGNPVQQGAATATFSCRIPRSVLDPASPPQGRPSLYGHGLLGSRNEVNAGTSARWPTSTGSSSARPNGPASPTRTSATSSP